MKKTYEISCPKCGRPMTVWEDEIIYDFGVYSRIRLEWNCVCGNRGVINKKVNNAPFATLFKEDSGDDS